MKRHWLVLLSFALFFLLFVQALTVFIESIYILELLSSSLDEKVLGVLFLFTPVFLYLFGKRAPRWLLWVVFMLFIIGRGMLPYLDTTARMVAGGIASGAGLILFPLMLVTSPEGKESSRWQVPSQGLALAIGLSVLLRTINYTLDPSLTIEYSWFGWLMGVGFGLTLIYFRWQPAEVPPQPAKGITSAAVGLVSLITLFYFMLSSPGVIARWTEGSYALIISLVSLMALLWLVISFARPNWAAEIKSNLLLLWNIVFTLAVVGTILVHTIKFPPTLESPPVVVSSPDWYLHIPLVLLLVSFPVIFIDFTVFNASIAMAQPTPRKMASGFLLGAFILVLMVFMNIFTNVWGYVEPISSFFRNKFWLPFLLILGLATILAYPAHKRLQAALVRKTTGGGLVWAGVVGGIIFIATCAAALMTDRTFVKPRDGNSLKIMTYNIQQANNVFGEKSYREQLALIKQVDPDIIGFQESDSARISLGNNDYMRYYANQLGYHAYYGPKTVTGTYGTTIMSKYPLENPRSVFTFSDQDEISTAEAEITVAGRRFTIYDVHPDGTDEAKMVFARTLVERAAQKDNVIAIGDYNLRGWEESYLLVDEYYKNAWMDIYPSGINDEGLDMSGRERIDHIFVSPHLQVQDPQYLLPPDSGTDHPAHWTDIIWK